MAAAIPGDIRWRCRRGMKELDLLLGRWLDDRWPIADHRLQQDFTRLLAEPDPQLAAWLLGGDRPGDARLASLVDDIVRSPD